MDILAQIAFFQPFCIPPQKKTRRANVPAFSPAIPSLAPIEIQIDM